MKKCAVTQPKQRSQIKHPTNNHKRRPSADRFYTSSSIGAVTSLISFWRVNRCVTLFIIIFAFALANLAGIGIFAPTNTYADSSSITLTVSSDLLSLDLLPNSTSGVFARSDDLNVRVTLSGVGGYTLSMRASNGANSSDPRALVNSSDSTRFIPTLSTAISESDFSSSSTYNNMWGYKPSKLNSIDNSNYQPAPNLSGDILDRTSGTNDEGDYTISFGARANIDTLAGAYSNTFVIAAVANATCNPNATGILEAICMQDMNDAVAASMEVNRQYELVDNRDSKVYQVAKMKDGRVWMTQNLDLDIEATPTNVMTLNADNTDINDNTGIYSDYTTVGGALTWTPVRATADAFTSDNNTPYSYDNGDTYYYTNTDGTNVTYNSKADCEAAHSATDCAHYHSGNYYNYSAAVASNNTENFNSGLAANSICPKGWRLPTANTNGNYGDANQTWLAEGITTGIVRAVEHYGIYALAGYNKLSTSPIYLARSGFRNNSSAPQKVNSNGYFRTDAVDTYDYAYTYYFTPVYPYPYERFGSTDGVWVTRGCELPVRCVARQSNTGGSTVITFDENATAATGTMNSQTINAGANSPLTTNVYTNTGYVFTGWNTASNGQGTHYDDGATYYAAVGTFTTNVTLYAEWAPAHTITVNAGAGIKISVDGGTTWTEAAGSTSIVAGEGQSVVLMAKDDTNGVVFNSWTLDSGVGEFSTTPWRKSTTKATNFIVGMGDATITASGIDTGYVVPSTESTVTMQDITSCPDWLTVGTKYLVEDNRDNETYYVAKLADGKCWMLDNLRLGSNDVSIALTPEDTNIPSNFTLPKGITSGFSGYTHVNINAAYKNDPAAPFYVGAGNKVGTYYNYCAASAGQVCTSGDHATNATQDICPAGWRMPTGDYEDKNTGLGEYYALYYAYGSNQADYKNALTVPLSGSFYSSAQGNIGSGGYFWSSTFNGGIGSYVMYASSGGVEPASRFHRYYGVSMRCLLSD